VSLPRARDPRALGVAVRARVWVVGEPPPLLLLVLVLLLPLPLPLPCLSAR
jgi:hypothetical protein